MSTCRRYWRALPEWQMLLLATGFFAAALLRAQLNTGIVEGVVQQPDGYALVGARLIVTGNPAVRLTLETNAAGEFAIVLPYGQYQLSIDSGPDTHAPITISVEPLQTLHLDLVIDASGILRREERSRSPGVWSDKPQQRTYPESITLQGLLLAREPASVTAPLDFTGLGDYRVAVESQRGYSWTNTQFKFLGMDATDSYQPGQPVIVPDVQAIDEVVVRSGFAQVPSTSYGTEVAIFPAQPGASWHGMFSTADTGSFLSSSNLPSPADRGMVQQAEQFRWFSRDGFQAGGPLTRWADIFATGTAQWSLQTVPLQPQGNDQRSRLLFGDIRGRIRASPRDQFDALYSGSRINVNDWGIPVNLESLVSRRASPPFVLPGGFKGEPGVDHFDLLQAGWIHRFSENSRLGVLEMRYGYSISHSDTDPPPQIFGVQEPKIEMLTGAIADGPPISDLATRTRQSVEAAWQPRAPRHQIAVGAGWKTSSPQNYVTIPSDVNLITVNGAPSEVVEFNTPLVSQSIIRSLEAYVADHVRLAAGLSLDAGVLTDFSRGSLPAQSRGSAPFVHPQTFAERPDLIVWNNASPRAGFAWQVPHLHRLVLRGTYFRLFSPLAGRYLDFGNPNSLGGNVYQWIDRNSDGKFQLGEQGALLMRFGGPYSSINPSLSRPYADEFNLGAEFALAPRTFGAIHLFRRDDKERLAAINTGVPPSAFTPVTILDPGPDGVAGTFDDRPLIVYRQNPSTLGHDQYLLTNPYGLRMLNTGLLAEIGAQWHGLLFHASFVAEKSYGPTNPGNAVFENDPGVVGALFNDPNTAINAAGRSYTDRAYVGKMQAIYRLPSVWGGFEVASIVDYMDGLVFARQLLVTGLPQGPFFVAATVRGSPEGGNRAEYVANWNLRILREFRLPRGTLAASGDVLNVLNAGHKIQENDISGPAFNSRLPVAFQEPRSLRLQLRFQF